MHTVENRIARTLTSKMVNLRPARCQTDIRGCLQFSLLQKRSLDFARYLLLYVCTHVWLY